MWTFVFLGFVAMVTFVFTAAGPSSQDMRIFGLFPVLGFAFVYVATRLVSLDDDLFLYQFLRQTLHASDVTEGEPL